MLILRIVLFLLLLVLGLFLIVKTQSMVNALGRIDFAEAKLGSSGTFTLWKLVGLVMIIMAFFTITGAMDPVWRIFFHK